MRLLRTLPLCLLCLLCLVAFVSTPFSTPSFAQEPASASRIAEKIDNNQLVTLKGNTLPVANAQNDLGRVSPQLPMDNLVLVLSRSPEQQAAFDDFVASQYESSSPNFHHWLLPEQVGEQFGPSLTDIATLSNWLATRGFTVAGSSKDRMTIRFSGTAGQVQAAFHVEIHKLSVRGEAHIANMGDPQIPAALASVVMGVKGLHDFRPRPLHRMGSTVTFDSETGKWNRADAASAFTRQTPLASIAGTPRSDFGVTFGSGTSAVLEEDVAPYDFATIYNVLPLWNASTPINGTGQTIAIVGTSDINLNDVSAFRSAFGLPAGLTPVEVQGANGSDPGICTNASATCSIGDLIENSLDVEWAGAVAPGAQVVLVTSGLLSSNDDPVYDSASYIVQSLGVSGSPVANARIVNVSYGLCELGEGTSGNTAYNQLWQTAASEGIAVFVASGDAGSATCDQGLDSSVPYEAQYGLTVSGIASTPYNTAVGGTDLNWGGSSAAPYWNTSNNSTTGASAAGYMPEIPWNDTCTNPLTLAFLQNQVIPALKTKGKNPTSPTDAESSCQFILTWYPTVLADFNVDLSPFVDVAGGGGGASTCTTSNGQTPGSCGGGYTKPTWQAGVPGIPSDGKRDLPDVSFFASNGFLGSAYLICVSAALPAGATSCGYPSTASTTASESLITAEEVGGTSVASPAMAGVMALINQKAGGPQGNPNSELYSLAARQNYSSCSTETGVTSSSCYFNDIDAGTGAYAGTIAMACKTGSANCTVVHTGDTLGVLPGFSSGTGYDQATGLGSLNVANVVNAWTTSVGNGTATLSATPSATSITASQSLTVSATVAGSNGVAPTGTVTLSGGGYTSSAQALASGAYTFSVPAFSLAGGSDTLTVSYGGDNNYAAANTTTSVTVTKVAPGAITVAPSATTFAPTAALIVNGAVNGVGGGPAPTGTVTLAGGGYTSTAATLTSGAYAITIPANTLAASATPYTLTVAYSGDNAYTAGTPGTANVTASNSAKAAPTVSVTPGATSVAFNAQLTVTGTVSGSSGTPTGTVTLSAAGLSGAYTSAAATLNGSGAYSITIPANNLSTGHVALTVAYSGDTNYEAGTGSGTVIVSQIAPSAITVVPAAASVAVNVPLMVTGSIAGPAGSPTPTGSVTLSSGAYASAQTALSSGAYSIVIPAGNLAAGTATLTVAYTGDSNYLAGSNTASVTVTKLAPMVTVSPASSSLNSAQSLQVTVGVVGPGATPAGTVTLSSGSYTSAPQALTAGSFTFTVPANVLSAGTDTLTATYSGNSIYSAGTGTANVTVAQSSFTLSASATTAISRGGLATSTVTISTTNNYANTVSLACALNSGGPSNQSGDAPVCSVPSTAIAVGSTALVSVTTVAATTGALVRPELRPNRTALAGLGLAALALLALLGIPVQRRVLRSMVGVLVLILTLGSLAACGGGGSSGGGGGGATNPGTASGTYTFTVKGTGSDPSNLTATTTFTVTVN